MTIRRAVLLLLAGAALTRAPAALLHVALWAWPHGEHLDEDSSAEAVIARKTRSDRATDLALGAVGAVDDALRLVAR